MAPGIGDVVAVINCWSSCRGVGGPQPAKAADRINATIGNKKPGNCLRKPSPCAESARHTAAWKGEKRSRFMAFPLQFCFYLGANRLGHDPLQVKFLRGKFRRLAPPAATAESATATKTATAETVLALPAALPRLLVTLDLTRITAPAPTRSAAGAGFTC